MKILNLTYENHKEYLKQLCHRRPSISYSLMNPTYSSEPLNILEDIQKYALEKNILLVISKYNNLLYKIETVEHPYITYKPLEKILYYEVNKTVNILFGLKKITHKYYDNFTKKPVSELPENTVVIGDYVYYKAYIEGDFLEKLEYFDSNKEAEEYIEKILNEHFN